MIIICEECGRKYKIDPEMIKGEQAKFKCKACNHINLVAKPRMDVPEPPAASVEETIDEVKKEIPKVPKPLDDTKPKDSILLKMPVLKLEGIGLRGKMLILFLLVPSIFIAAAGVFYVRTLGNLSSLILDDSKKVVSQMAESAIAETSRAVARECRLYLVNHPDFRKETLNQEEEFRKIAVRKVGTTGYTAFYEIPGPDNVWRTWAHDNPKIVAIDMSELRQPLGKNFQGFWSIYTQVKNGGESSGYYTWQEKDGTFREKYMVSTPVEGTPFVVAATTYLDEFTKPMTLLETKAEEQTSKSKKIILITLGGTLFLISCTVSLYGHRLAGKIKSLTQVTDRISIGDLDADIRINSKDEIGALAEAISRMQDSIRLSIERLRRRR
jgi:HAMP domain-containing protein